MDILVNPVNILCNSIRNDNTSVCSGRGICDNGTCVCNFDINYGTNCELYSSYSFNIVDYPGLLLCDKISFNTSISSMIINGYTNFTKQCRTSEKCSFSLSFKLSAGGLPLLYSNRQIENAVLNGNVLSFPTVYFYVPERQICPQTSLTGTFTLSNGYTSLDTNRFSTAYNLTAIQINMKSPESSLNLINSIVKSSDLNEQSTTEITQKMDDFLSSALTLYKDEKNSTQIVSDKLSENAKSTSFSILSTIYSKNLATNATEQVISLFSELLVVGENITLVSNVNNIPLVRYNSSSVNITISSFKIDNSNNANSLVSIGDSVNVKLDLSQLSISSPMGLSLISYSKNLKSDNFSSQATLMSFVTEFKFYNNDQYYKLNNLTNPITLKFPILNNFVQSKETKLSCRYWDENLLEWSSYGCKFIGIESSTIICSCNHTTSFSTFMQFSNVTLTAAQKVQVANLYYAQIAFGVFFFILSMFIMICLIIFRNKQPVTSRMITPFMGMTALIISSVIIGIVQRSVLVDYLFASTSQLWEQGLTAANIISNVTMIVVNSLNLTAILSYLIQVVRFQILKYLYDVLGKGNWENSNRYKFIRILTSKQLFTVAVLTSLVLNMLYWVLWVILERSGVIGLETYVWIVGISYICIILFYSFIISLIAVSDFVITLIKNDSYTKDKSRKQSKLHSESQANLVSNNSKKEKFNLEIPKGLKKFLVQDSPLYFRIEMLLYLICFILMIIQLVLGLISNSFRFEESTYNTALSYEMISFIFEVLYTLSYIMVFGGFPLLIICKQMIQSKLNSTKVEESQDELIQLLKDKGGYELFESFCENEFSTENLYLMDILMENTDFSKNPNETCQLLNKINDNFIKNGSVCEVNISSPSKKLFNEIMKLVNSKEIELSNSNISEKLTECYIDLKDQIQINLSDTYSRFLFSPMYSSYSKQLELLQKTKLDN